jgi:hypothetical protein
LALRRASAPEIVIHREAFRLLERGDLAAEQAFADLAERFPADTLRAFTFSACAPGSATPPSCWKQMTDGVSQPG